MAELIPTQLNHKQQIQRDMEIIDKENAQAPCSCNYDSDEHEGGHKKNLPKRK